MTKRDNPLHQRIEAARGLLSLLDEDGAALCRIQDLVQENQKFFGARVGDSCLETAANKLEALVQDWRNRKP